MKPNSINYFDYEQELNSLFRHYPSDLIEASLLPYFPKEEEKCTPEQLNITQLFYLELHQSLQRCLAAYQQYHNYPEPATEQRAIWYNLQNIVKLLQAVIPIGYIFCHQHRQRNCSLTILLDQYLYQPMSEIQSLIKLVGISFPKFSCTLYSYGAMINLIEQGHFYYANLCVPSNCIYQRSINFCLPLTNPEKFAITKLKAIANFRQQNQKAEAFFSAAETFYQTNSYPMAAFMLQQSCEFIFNSIIIAFKGQTMKTHDLLALRKQACYYLPQLIGLIHQKPKKELAILTQIQEAYLSARYDESYQIEVTQLAICMEATANFMLGTRAIFEDFIKI